MDFSSILGTKPSTAGSHQHPATILKSVQNNGAFKVYQDPGGHVQRTEIILPQGKIVVIKDYETVPAFAQFKVVTVSSPEEISLGTLTIVPEDRKRPNSTLRFYDGNSQIGTGAGDIGIAIANKLLTLDMDPRQASKSSVDEGVMASIQGFLQNKK